MKLKRKVLILSLAFIFCMSVIVPNISYAKGKDIEVFIDSKKVDFDVQPEVVNGRTLVPMRKIFEDLGAKIDWDEATSTVTALRNGKEMKLRIGEKFVVIDGVKHKIDTEPILKGGRTLVPLRVISEGYGLHIKWLKTNKQVRIYSSSIGITNKGRELQLGIGLNELKNLMGDPIRIDDDLMNTKWYVYNNTKETYKDFIMVGIREDRVVAFKTNSINWRLTDEIQPGKKYMGQEYYKNLNEKYREKGFYIEVLPYVKEHKINTIAAYEMNDDYEYHNMTITEGDFKFTYFRPIVKEKYSEDKINDLERQIFDLTNVQRVNRGLKTLDWNDDLRKIAKDHSIDMGHNNYFSHGSLTETFNKRMQTHLVKHDWTTIGENLVFGVHDSIGYINAWYNSDGHRVNLLSSKFDKLGVGGYYNKNKSHMYFTQNFAK